MARSTVGEYVKRARRAGLSSWKAVETLDDVELENLLFPGAPPARPSERPLPIWSEVHTELQKPGVTRQLLWQEYKEDHPAGVGYSQFCDLYRAYRGRLDLSLRRAHKAGERLFVDYCGQTVPIRDPSSGEIRQAQIFVAVMGASNFTFAEATWSQQLADWLGSHERAFAYFGGVTEEVVPDNLRSGVQKPCRYEPVVNPSYQELASHYGVAVLPARVRKPKDKAKVENGVLVVERWILAKLRKREFLSFSELNAAIGQLLEELNDRPFRKIEGTRRSRFELLDQPRLRPLPAERFEMAEWLVVRVGPDYHVEIGGHYYSVPHELRGEQLDARLTDQAVELLHRSRRVACHRRSWEVGGLTTVPEHQPKAHREIVEQSPEKLLDWAQTVGLATSQAMGLILTDGRHWRQSFQAATGLGSLGKRYGLERLEAACARALRIRSVSYTSLRSILDKGLDQRPQPDSNEAELPATDPGHLRGAAYFDAASVAEEVPSSC